MLLNKIDKIDKEKLFKKITELKDLYDFQEIIPLSALKKDNLKTLLKTIKEYLPVGEKIYPEDELTNISIRFMASELVREKILELTKDEIPHTVTCYTEEFKEEDNLVTIRVLIVVDRDNIKKIIIGRNGSMLKKIGTMARGDIENLVGKKVFLETYVKTINSWRDKEKYLKELNIDESE